MKKITLFLSSLCVAAILNAQTPATTATANSAATLQKTDISSVVEISDDNHDFGRIPYGKPVTYDVLVKNISSDSVKIENVKVGCGCTTPKYEQGKSFGPGETAKVTLGFSGYAMGNFEKTAEIFLNNGLSKVVKFHGEGYKAAETSAPANTQVEKLKTAGQ